MGSIAKILGVSAALLLATVIMLPNTAQAKGFKNLSFMGGYAERHPTVLNCWLPYFKATEEALKGELTFNYFSTNNLYPEKEAFGAVSDGRVDLGVVRASMFPGAMNLITVVDIPGLAPNAVVGSLVAQEVVEKFSEVRAEFPQNTVPWTMWSSAAYQLHTIKPVRNMADLKGKKIIVWDSVILDIAKTLGANPIRLASPDTYMALSKGMADGVICPIAPVRSFKISDATKYHTMLNLGVGTFNMFIYKPLWDEMSDTLRNYLTVTGGMAMALEVGKSLEDGVIIDTKWMLENGHEMITLDDATRATFIDPLEKFKEDWVKERIAEGTKEDVVRSILTYAEERAAFHSEEMNKGTYGAYTL